MPDTTPDPPPSAQASIAGRHIRALFLADNFTQVVRVAEAMLETVVSGAQVALWWTLRPGSPQASRLHCAPRGLRPWADPQQACAAMLAKTMLRGAPDDAGKAVWALPVQGHGGGQAVLQLQANVADFPRMENDATLVQSVELVARRVATLIEMRLLKRSVRRHERSERVQKALFHIADLSSSDISLDAFYAAVHAEIGQLLYARNFIVALLTDDGKAFDYPYSVDERDDRETMFQRRPLARGLTEYVLRTGKPLLLDANVRGQLIAAGEIQPIGSPSVAWMGVPLAVNGRNEGVLVVQSYTKGIGYGSLELELLAFVAQHIAAALQRKKVAESLKAAYADLQAQIEELHRTQGELIENEKMASLGRLVAGVAHEINTPLGIGVTAASHLDEIFVKIERSTQAQESPATTKSLASARRCIQLILNNLGKAAQLVRSFKQVAVDQTNEVRRRIGMRAFLDDVLISLHPRLKTTPHRVEIECDPLIELVTLPGALYQIVSNIVLNAVLHAFDDADAGLVRIRVSITDGMLDLSIADNGKGMPEDVRKRVFEPFFTTRRGSGGTGLGLHLVYNLVTQLLGGSILCASVPGQGTTFTIRLPLAAGATGPGEPDNKPTLSKPTASAQD